MCAQEIWNQEEHKGARESGGSWWRQNMAERANAHLESCGMTTYLFLRGLVTICVVKTCICDYMNGWTVSLQISGKQFLLVFQSSWHLTFECSAVLNKGGLAPPFTPLLQSQAFQLQVPVHFPGRMLPRLQKVQISLSRSCNSTWEVPPYVLLCSLLL